jgi:hypothetical protein
VLGYDAIRARGADAVKIAEQHERSVCGERAEPVRADEQQRLRDSFAAAESEVAVDDVNGSERGLGFGEESDAFLAAVPGAVAGQLRRALQRERIAADNRVAVLLVAVAHRGMKHVLPAELCGDHGSLIDRGGAFAAGVELLQPTTSADMLAITSAMRLSERWRSIPTQPWTL